MSDRDSTKGAAVAAAVLGLLLSVGCMGSDDKEDTQEQLVKCLGGNECAGMSECAGGPETNQCKGMNECKGHGWSYEKTAADCTAAGGMVQGA